MLRPQTASAIAHIAHTRSAVEALDECCIEQIRGTLMAEQLGERACWPHPACVRSVRDRAKAKQGCARCLEVCCLEAAGTAPACALSTGVG